MADGSTYCLSCGATVAYFIVEEPTKVDVRGTIFTYNEIHARCNVCLKDVYVPWVNDENVERRLYAYNKAKEAENV